MYNNIDSAYTSVSYSSSSFNNTSVSNWKLQTPSGSIPNSIPPVTAEHIDSLATHQTLLTPDTSQPNVSSQSNNKSNANSQHHLTDSTRMDPYDVLQSSNNSYPPQNGSQYNTNMQKHSHQSSTHQNMGMNLKMNSTDYIPYTTAPINPNIPSSTNYSQSSSYSNKKRKRDSFQHSLSTVFNTLTEKFDYVSGIVNSPDKIREFLRPFKVFPQHAPHIYMSFTPEDLSLISDCNDESLLKVAISSRFFGNYTYTSPDFLERITTYTSTRPSQSQSQSQPHPNSQGLYSSITPYPITIRAKDALVLTEWFKTTIPVHLFIGITLENSQHIYENAQEHETAIAESLKRSTTGSPPSTSSHLLSSEINSAQFSSTMVHFIMIDNYGAYHHVNIQAINVKPTDANEHPIFLAKDSWWSSVVCNPRELLKSIQGSTKVNVAVRETPTYSLSGNIHPQQHHLYSTMSQDTSTPASSNSTANTIASQQIGLYDKNNLKRSLALVLHVTTKQSKLAQQSSIFGFRSKGKKKNDVVVPVERVSRFILESGVYVQNGINVTSEIGMGTGNGFEMPSSSPSSMPQHHKLSPNNINISLYNCTSKHLLGSYSPYLYPCSDLSGCVLPGARQTQSVSYQSVKFIAALSLIASPLNQKCYFGFGPGLRNVLFLSSSPFEKNKIVNQIDQSQYTEDSPFNDVFELYIENDNDHQRYFHTAHAIKSENVDNFRIYFAYAIENPEFSQDILTEIQEPNPQDMMMQNDQENQQHEMDLQVQQQQQQEELQQQMLYQQQLEQQQQREQQQLEQQRHEKHLQQQHTREHPQSQLEDMSTSIVPQDNNETHDEIIIDSADILPNSSITSQNNNATHVQVLVEQQHHAVKYLSTPKTSTLQHVEAPVQQAVQQTSSLPVTSMEILVKSEPVPTSDATPSAIITQESVALFPSEIPNTKNTITQTPSSPPPDQTSLIASPLETLHSNLSMESTMSTDADPLKYNKSQFAPSNSMIITPLASRTQSESESESTDAAITNNNINVEPSSVSSSETRLTPQDINKRTRQQALPESMSHQQLNSSQHLSPHTSLPLQYPPQHSQSFSQSSTMFNRSQQLQIEYAIYNACDPIFDDQAVHLSVEDAYKSVAKRQQQTDAQQSRTHSKRSPSISSKQNMYHQNPNININYHQNQHPSQHQYPHLPRPPHPSHIPHPSYPSYPQAGMYHPHAPPPHALYPPQMILPPHHSGVSHPGHPRSHSKSPYPQQSQSQSQPRHMMDQEVSESDSGSQSSTSEDSDDNSEAKSKLSRMSKNNARQRQLPEHDRNTRQLKQKQKKQSHSKHNKYNKQHRQFVRESGDDESEDDSNNEELPSYQAQHKFNNYVDEYRATALLNAGIHESDMSEDDNLSEDGDY